MYYVYLLKSLKTGEIYFGYTQNLKRRFEEHNQGRNLSTKHKFPWKLAYYESYASEKDAKLREKRLKYDGRGLSVLKKRISNSLI